MKPGDTLPSTLPGELGDSLRSDLPISDLPQAATRSLRRSRRWRPEWPVVRALLAALALWAVCRAIVLALGWEGGTAAQRTALVGLHLAVGVAAACGWLVPPRRLVPWLLSASLATVGLAVLSAAWLGLGLRDPALMLLGVLVAASGLGAGARVAAIVAASGAFGLAVLAARHGSAAAPPGTALWLAAGLLAGWGCGWAFARLLGSRQRRADEREARFSGLLGIAVDAYWEIDADYRLVALRDPQDARGDEAVEELLGLRPWDLPPFACDPDALDALRADLESRAAFRDLPVQWRSAHGTLRHFSLAGKPRFDERGLFRGYWGVARELTASVRAQEALRATESLYLELFARIPTPLVLHRGGLVIDANPAAVRLFGHDSLEAMLGRDILERHEEGDSRERARRRLAEVESLPVGEALPAIDLRLAAPGGRRMTVRTADVRVSTDDGPATLSIYVDDTERRRAEETVRRSEALLSHLVATSPDVITLSDLSTGRFAMVNHSFERITGYRSAEVVGRSAAELGLWADPAELEVLVERMRQQGTARELPCELLTKGGQRVQLRVSGAVFAMDRRSYLVVNGRDVTEQERSRRERDAILDNAWVGIAVTRDRRFVLTNPRFDEMYGWPRGGLAGEGRAEAWAGQDAYAALADEIGERLALGEVVELERLAQRRDGSSFMARLVAKTIDPAGALRSGVLWLVEDVTEKHQVREALARARDQAEAANRAKSAFLANTSHELRTPLNGMLGLARMAREPGLDETRRRQYLDQIVDNAQALAAIVSDVLDLSKIEAGKLTLESATFDLPELLAQVRQTCSAFAIGRPIELQFEIDDSLQGHVRGDPLRLRQILWNYLTNALKFTEQGQVRLVARRVAGDRVRFEVHDSGPGLDEATQARLFRPFTQADESTTRRFGGTGLGLSICRELAQLMGGEVGVSSRPGEGACFWAEVSLPRVDAPQASQVEVPERDLAGLRVLLVEDNPVNMLIGAAMLERWGLHVEQAVDGQQAVQAVLQAHQAGRPFDLVLMDVQMPVMGGYEATRALRAQEAGRRLPIVALTAAALVTEREEARQAGMDDFLTKPIDADRLRAAISRWAGGR